MGPAITAVLYRTRGGKFVATLSKDSEYETLIDTVLEQQTNRDRFHKAQVFDTFDAAIAWFRPGRLTDALRKQLGLASGPVSIEQLDEAAWAYDNWVGEGRSPARSRPCFPSAFEAESEPQPSVGGSRAARMRRF